ncbi:MerR family transcriptional regulator [Roseibium salinum]|nr:MerR family transcriptional regulator [Roseibium salinum]
MRDGGGRRVYDAAVLRWIEFLDRLKATGMGIRDRLRYAHLRSKGNSSLTERRKLLEVHRVKVAGDLARLAETLDVLDEKDRSLQKDGSGRTRRSGPRKLRPDRTRCAAKFWKSNP